MAHPFRIFRKHQKTLLVIAGVILMFVFVLGDPLSQLLRQSGRGGDPRRSAQAVAVKWDGGELTNNELHMLVFKRQLVNRFLASIEQLGRRMAMDAGVQPRPLLVEPVGGPERPEDGVEQHVVQTQIFADAARQAGMSISEEQILHYLEEVGRNRVSPDQMRAVLSRLQVQNRTASVQFMMDALREELLAQNFLVSYQFAWGTVLPEEQWRDWLRVNDRVVVEAAAIPVESFVVDVPEPTDEELTAFFDLYKEREPRPDVSYNTELPSPFPAFAMPRKVDVQYLRADFDQFVGKIEDQITDAEIEEYYEKNKDPYFIRADTGLTDALSTEKPTEEPAAPTDEAAGPVDETPAPADPSDPTPEEGSRNDPAPQRGSFRLAAFQQEEEAPVDAVTESAGSVEEAGPGSAEEVKPEGTAPAADEALSLPPTEDAADADAAADAEKPAADKKPVEYQPLEEVRDQIRRQLAEMKVHDQLQGLLGHLEVELNSSYNKYFSRVLDAEAAERPAPEPPPELADLSTLAQKHGLEAGRTGPVSYLELRNLPVGMSAKADENNYRLARLMFSPELELYQPLSSFDLDGNRYLVMKTSDTPGKVPELKDVREEVVQAWKRQKAADLALEAAEEAATKAQTAGAWLADYFADDRDVEVVRTDPFSFLTIGSVSPRGQVTSFRLSEPDGIVAAGPAFMQEAFELEDGKVGAVLNHDHTIAYVVRPIEHQDSQEALREAFLSEANQWYGLSIMSNAHKQLAARVLISNLLASVGLDWQRTPDEIIRDE